MAWQDNSGDIILDAVLTDTGRYRLAKGDGSFKIAKYAFGDDEIDYSLYNKNHASGSAYYDLAILQLPTFEAFTNNGSSMKSKLISLPRNNLLYLSVVKLNRQAQNWHSSNMFLVAVDKDTEDDVAVGTNGTKTIGIMWGLSKFDHSYIRVDQGLDTTEIPPTLSLDPELLETQYIVEIDNRLGKISDLNKNLASPSYIDDDNIASYYLSLGTAGNFVKQNTDTFVNESALVVRGPRGTTLEFLIASSVELTTSTFLFSQLGGTTTVNSVPVYYIDTNIRIVGATTGASLDIPVRFIKKV